jgi:hypothetical protein
MCAPQYASFKCGIQEVCFRDTSYDDQKGVTKVTNLQLYKLRVDDVLSDTPNAMLQMHALHVAENAFLISKSSFVGA